MRVLLCLVLLAAVAQSVAAGPWLHPQHLPTEQDREGRYSVLLTVANPASVLTLRLDPRLDVTVLPHRVREQSQTSTLDNDGIHGSEIFYLGRYKLRLPVRWDDAAAAAYGVTGALALGAPSELWRWWPEHTLSRGRWTLGAYDDSARQAFLARTPLLPVLPGATDNTVVGAEVLGVPRELALYSADDTVLPLDAWTAQNFTVALPSAGASCDLATLLTAPSRLWGACLAAHPGVGLERADHVVRDGSTGFERLAVRRLEAGDPPNQLQLGAAAARGVWRWQSWLRDVAAVEPAARGHDGSQFTVVLALASAATLYWWLMLVRVRPSELSVSWAGHERTEGRKRYHLLLAVMSYTVVLSLMTLVGLLGFERLDRVLRFHYGVFWGTLYAAIVVVYMTLGLVWMVAHAWRDGRRALLPIPHPLVRTSVEGLLFFTLWLALLGFAQALWVVLLVLGAATWGALASTRLALDVLASQWSAYGWSVRTSCVVAVAFYFQWVATSSVPLVMAVFWPEHPRPWAVSIIYVLVAVIIPAWYVFRMKQP